MKEMSYLQHNDTRLTLLRKNIDRFIRQKLWNTCHTKISFTTSKKYLITPAITGYYWLLDSTKLNRVSKL